MDLDFKQLLLNAGFLILFTPLIISFIIFFFLQNFNKKVVKAICIVGSFFYLFISVYLFDLIWGGDLINLKFDWILLANSSIQSGFLFDNYNVLMLLIVSLIALAVNIFSTIYMQSDKHINRYYAYLQFFVFAMYGVVLVDNLLILFIFWELVGFASYLLIGFWNKNIPPAKASLKAFLFNKTADLGFLVGLMVVYYHFNTFNIVELEHLVFSFHSSFFWIHVGAVGLLLGSMGKSAQFPFQSWLPDAMEGPTPVSALIHAATMVAAGVYLLVRISFIFTNYIDQYVVIIGLVTALYGAICATSQYDIKKILAFSTVSQLGLMFVAVGLGGFEAAFFHLTTHAFFKACLFLSAGSVIFSLHNSFHYLEHSTHQAIDAQDIRNMGGLISYLPLTFLAFFISGLALIGFPFTSGFLSKELILGLAWHQYLSSNSVFSLLVFLVLIFISMLTAFYVIRVLYKTFGGKFVHDQNLKNHNIGVKENKWVMGSQLTFLAMMSLGFVYSFTPVNSKYNWILAEIVENKEFYLEIHPEVLFGSFGAIFIGFLLFITTRRFFKSQLWAFKFFKNQFYIEAAYQNVIIKPNLFIASAFTTFDIKVLNHFVNIWGVFNIVLANVIKFFDAKIVDGMVYILPFSIRIFAKLFSKLTNGKIQFYLAIILFIILIFISIIFFI